MYVTITEKKFGGLKNLFRSYEICTVLTPYYCYKYYEIEILPYFTEGFLYIVTKFPTDTNFKQDPNERRLFIDAPKKTLKMVMI